MFYNAETAQCDLSIQSMHALLHTIDDMYVILMELRYHSQLQCPVTDTSTKVHIII